MGRRVTVFDFRRYRSLSHEGHILCRGYKLRADLDEGKFDPGDQFAIVSLLCQCQSVTEISFGLQRYAGSGLGQSEIRQDVRPRGRCYCARIFLVNRPRLLVLLNRFPPFVEAEEHMPGERQGVRNFQFQFDGRTEGTREEVSGDLHRVFKVRESLDTLLLRKDCLAEHPQSEHMRWWVRATPAGQMIQTPPSVLFGGCRIFSRKVRPREQPEGHAEAGGLFRLETKNGDGVLPLFLTHSERPLRVSPRQWVRRDVALLTKPEFST